MGGLSTIMFSQIMCMQFSAVHFQMMSHYNPYMPYMAYSGEET